MFDFSTTVLHIFLDALGNENISIAISVFARLLMIEIVLFGVAMALSRVECSEIFYKSLMIVFYLYFIQNYQEITDAMFDFFSSTGIKLGGSSLSLSSDFLMDPSSIMKTCWEIYVELWTPDNWFNLLFRRVDQLFMLINTLVIITAFFIIEACAVLRVLEFYLISTVSLILFPFGIIKPLVYLSETCIGNIFKLGIKLMTFTFVCSISVNIFENHIAANLSSNPSFMENISCSTASCLICVIIWKVPELAAGLITGNPNIGAFGAIKAGANAVKAILSKGISKIAKALKKK
jgi:P-type conjugative transfer protein TrbL